MVENVCLHLSQWWMKVRAGRTTGLGRDSWRCCKLQQSLKKTTVDPCLGVLWCQLMMKMSPVGWYRPKTGLPIHDENGTEMSPQHSTAGYSTPRFWLALLDHLQQQDVSRFLTLVLQAGLFGLGSECSLFGLWRSWWWMQPLWPLWRSLWWMQPLWPLWWMQPLWPLKVLVLNAASLAFEGLGIECSLFGLWRS